MSERYAELREAIRDATPGPWATLRGFRLHVVPADQAERPLGASIDPQRDAEFAQPICEIHEAGNRFDGWEEFSHRRFDRNRNFADARYIAAANPSVIAALLAERDALVEALRNIAAYDGRLDASEAARSWRTAAEALSKTGAGM